MSKLYVWLSSLLAVQLLLALGLFLGTQSGHSNVETKPLLPFEQAGITKVVIHDEDGDISIAKTEGEWVLPDSLPANTNKLDSVLSTLKDLKTNWPVTTTSSSHQRFEVAEDKFQRRVQLYQGDELSQELFIGSSPGFKKAHVRSAEGGEVYALGINSFDFPAEHGDWLDKTLLAAKDIKEIKGSDYVLKKADESWNLAGVGSEAKGKVNKEKADELSEALSALTVNGLTEEAPDFNSDKAVSLEVVGSETLRYQFLQDESKYYVKRDDRTQAFEISQYEYDRLAGLGLEDLVVVEVEETVSEESEKETTAVENSEEGKETEDS